MLLPYQSAKSGRASTHGRAGGGSCARAAQQARTQHVTDVPVLVMQQEHVHIPAAQPQAPQQPQQRYPPAVLMPLTRMRASRVSY